MWFEGVEVLSATVDGNNVKVTWRFQVLTEYSNPAELLHGAAQALFGELISSWIVGHDDVLLSVLVRTMY